MTWRNWWGSGSSFRAAASSHLVLGWNACVDAVLHCPSMVGPAAVGVDGGLSFPGPPKLGHAGLLQPQEINDHL